MTPSEYAEKIVEMTPKLPDNLSEEQMCEWLVRTHLGSEYYPEWDGDKAPWTSRPVKAAIKAAIISATVAMEAIDKVRLKTLFSDTPLYVGEFFQKEITYWNDVLQELKSRL